MRDFLGGDEFGGDEREEGEGDGFDHGHETEGGAEDLRFDDDGDDGDEAVGVERVADTCVRRGVPSRMSPVIEAISMEPSRHEGYTRRKKWAVK